VRTVYLLKSAAVYNIKDIYIEYRDWFCITAPLAKKESVGRRTRREREHSRVAFCVAYGSEEKRRSCVRRRACNSYCITHMKYTLQPTHKMEKKKKK
jgi:hypothetical protein